MVLDHFIYQADMWCADCAEAIKTRLAEDGTYVRLVIDQGVNLSDETAYDSDDYPKGPYDDSDNSESDTPDHCAGCGVFLENDLTSDGYRYVLDALIHAMRGGHGNYEVLDAWADQYRDDYQDGAQALVDAYRAWSNYERID